MERPNIGDIVTIPGTCDKGLVVYVAADYQCTEYTIVTSTGNLVVFSFIDDENVDTETYVKTISIPDIVKLLNEDNKDNPKIETIGAIDSELYGKFIS